MADPARRAWWTGERSCFNANGAPKAAFASRRAALRATAPGTRGLHAYRCPMHGWHLGHGSLRG